MSQSAVFISLPGLWSLLCRRSSRTLGWGVVAVVLSLSGCIQDSPPSSRERAVALLQELLQDEGPEIRRTAAESLGKIGDPRAIDSILPLLHDPVAVVREASVIAMGRMRPTATEGVVALLTQALEDPTESVRQAAVVAIGEIEPGPRLLEPVLGLLRSSDGGVRRSAVRGLLQVDSSQSISVLVAAGRDSDAEVRQGIVAAVGEWGGAAVSPWLRERLAKDSSPGVRAEAAYRLGMLSEPDTRAALETAVVVDTDSGVRRWAKRGGALGCYAGTIQRLDEFDQLFAGFFVDVGELNAHPRKQQMSFRLVAGPGDLGFGLVLLPGTIGQGKLDGQFGSRSQRGAAFDEQPACTDAAG